MCEPGTVDATLRELVESPAAKKQKAKFALATDGEVVAAENLIDGESMACAYAELSDHFGFFLALAGITTVRQIRENARVVQSHGHANGRAGKRQG